MQPRTVLVSQKLMVDMSINIIRQFNHLWNNRASTLPHVFSSVIDTNSTCEILWAKMRKGEKPQSIVAFIKGKLIRN